MIFTSRLVIFQLYSSDGGSVEFRNRSSVGIGWCIPCDFADYNRFTHIHWIKYFLCLGRKFRSIWCLPCVCICLCVKGHNCFSYITQCKTYCQSSRRLSVSENLLPCAKLWLVVHINLVIAYFVQASMMDYWPEVPQSPDARLSWAFVARGFISMISIVARGFISMIRLKFQDFNICPNILHVDADANVDADADTDADADAGGIAIALLH